MIESVRPLRRVGVMVVLGLGMATVGTAAQEPVDRAMVSRIIDEGLNRSAIMELFNHFTNVIGPRLTASPGLKRAVDYSVQRLDAWGLSDVHTEAWEFGRGWSLRKLTLEMIEPRYFPLTGYPEAWTPSTDGELVLEPAYLGGMSEQEIRGRAQAFRGKAILAYATQDSFIVDDRPQPTEFAAPVRIGAPPFIRASAPVDRRSLPDFVKSLGAAVHLVPTQGQHGTAFVLGNRRTPDDAVPTVVLLAEHYNMIARLVEAGETVRLRVNVQAEYQEDDPNGYNVLAEIPGTDPAVRDEVVMIGAHLDSWHSATGATDNADGAAAVMEAMRILKALGVRPRRTIRMALWSGEEQGLLGARAYVERHYEGEANRAARERFNVYFNHDPGTGAIYGFYLEENEAVKPIFDAWLAPLRAVGARRNQIEKIGSTDHLAFIRAGLPGFNTLQDYRDYDVRDHHTNMDFYERLSESDLKESAIVLATFAYLASVREQKIPRAAVIP